MPGFLVTFAVREHTLRASLSALARLSVADEPFLATLTQARITNDVDTSGYT